MNTVYLIIFALILLAAGILQNLVSNWIEVKSKTMKVALVIILVVLSIFLALFPVEQFMSSSNEADSDVKVKDEKQPVKPEAKGDTLWYAEHKSEIEYKKQDKDNFEMFRQIEEADLYGSDKLSFVDTTTYKDTLMSIFNYRFDSLFNSKEELIADAHRNLDLIDFVDTIDYAQELIELDLKIKDKALVHLIGDVCIVLLEQAYLLEHIIQLKHTDTICKSRKNKNLVINRSRKNDGRIQLKLPQNYDSNTYLIYYGYHLKKNPNKFYYNSKWLTIED